MPEEVAFRTKPQIAQAQIRRATSLWLQVADLPAAARKKRYERELAKMKCYQRRNEQACKSHTKTRREQLRTLGLDVEQLESCLPEDTS